MTTISGQIYQLTNGKTGAELVNRFPRTVIEAVYGLSSYLQTQFGSLADIYMPIEGITESKTGQEFVYRKSPATIKAKSLTLDRIKGKTLAWNQTQRYVSNFEKGAVNPSGCTVSYQDGIAVIQGSAASGAQSAYFMGVSDMPFIIGHKYLALITYTNTANNYITVYWSGGSGAFGSLPKSDTFTQYKVVAVNNYASGSTGFGFFSNSQSDSWEIKIKSLNSIDLTLLYGSEIDGLTNAEILAKYEADFGTGYYPYNAGTLISNDASAIETVGFNQWDEEWERGSFNLITGEKSDYANNFRSKNPIKIVAGTYYMKAPFSSFVLSYDASGNYLGYSSVDANGTTFTPEAGAAYILFTVGAKGADYANDICINLSDPAKNGTYEPYRKTTLQLGLNNFKVKDGNGNITTITGGLKSAGTVYDEIVGNKYIKRVGSVDLGTLGWSKADYGFYSWELNISSKAGGHSLNSKYPEQTLFIRGDSALICLDTSYSDAATFKTAMSGVMLYYELATPIEYELVEPLVYSMAAGTTEARISPNADGLSAPFCCDMTYDANANNDSANAQYALAAGRLYNTHKIWGQDFNGTQDVTGALTGVTTLSASGALTAGSFVKSGGTASQFLKANGSVDSNAYYYSGNANKNTVDWTAKNLVLAGTITGATTIAASGNITSAAQLVSSVANGTAPLAVTSSTLVVNLNADKFDGYEASDFEGFLQSLQAQIKSVASRSSFDELKASVLQTDILAVSGFAAGMSVAAGHVYLTGAQPSSSTGNTTQLIFGTTSTQYLAVSSNTNQLIINPTESTTTGQAVIGVNGASTHFDTGGNFGIGNSIPQYKLDVSGTFRATGAALLSSTLGVTGLLTANAGVTIPAGQKLTLGSQYMEWDATNSAWKITGNVYATGFVSAGGVSTSGGTSIVGLQKAVVAYDFGQTQITASVKENLKMMDIIEDTVVGSEYIRVFSPAGSYGEILAYMLEDIHVDYYILWFGVTRDTYLDAQAQVNSCDWLAVIDVAGTFYVYEGIR